MFRRSLLISPIIFICLAMGVSTHAQSPKLVNGEQLKRITASGQVKELQGDNLNDNYTKFENVILIQDVSPRKSDFLRINKRPNTCTATIVGPNTFITAAHCVEPYDDAKIKTTSVFLVNRNNNLQVEFRCTTPPEYSEREFPDNPNRLPGSNKLRSSFDVSICYSKTLSGGSSFFNTPQKDVIGLSFNAYSDMSGIKSKLKKKARLDLAGYGCRTERFEKIESKHYTDDRGRIAKSPEMYRVTTFRSAEEKNDKSFYLKYGVVTLSNYAKQKEFLKYELNTNAFILAESAYHDDRKLSGVKVCKGDSGGPVFHGKSRPRIMALISAMVSPLSKDKESIVFHNKLVDLNHPKIKKFIDDFLIENGNRPKICGVNIPYGSSEKSICKN